MTSGPAPRGKGWQFSLGQLKPVCEAAVVELRAAKGHLRERWRGADARLSRPRPRLSARRGAAGEGAGGASGRSRGGAGGQAAWCSGAAARLEPRLPRAAAVPLSGVTQDSHGNTGRRIGEQRKRRRWSRSPPCLPSSAPPQSPRAGTGDPRRFDSCLFPQSATKETPGDSTVGRGEPRAAV